VLAPCHSGNRDVVCVERNGGEESMGRERYADGRDGEEKGGNVRNRMAVGKSVPCADSDV
jgi:hypothetical protein